MKLLPEHAKRATWQEALIAKAQGFAVYVNASGSAKKVWDYCTLTIAETFTQPGLEFAILAKPRTFTFQAVVDEGASVEIATGKFIELPSDIDVKEGTRVEVQMKEIF